MKCRVNKRFPRFAHHDRAAGIARGDQLSQIKSKFKPNADENTTQQDILGTSMATPKL